MTIKVERTKKDPIDTDSGLAGEALTSHEYRFVKRSGSATGNATVIKCGDGEKGDGVLLPMGDGTTTIATGTNVNFQTLGAAEVEAGAAISAGVEVASDSVGRAVAATATEYILGVTREGAVGAGHLVSVYLRGPTYKAS